MMNAKLRRFVRIKQLHTIISQQTIKPSSPTPPRLRTHMLSMADQILPNCHISLLFFYQNYNNCDIEILKNSLARSLTHYYPFAGRFLTPFANHIDCNDQGVVFLEASNDSQLNDYIIKKDQDELLQQLIPNGLGFTPNKTSPSMMQVQLNHFKCGAAALAVTISHKVGDVLTMVEFVNHWATVTRGGSPINPTFLPHSFISNDKVPEFYKVRGKNRVTYVARRFVFSNLKLNELKNKINAMGTTKINPTRVESLTSLIFRCAVDAAAMKCGSFQPSNLIQVVDMRKKFSVPLPKVVAGNLAIGVVAMIMDSSQIELNRVITSLRNEMNVLDRVKNVKEIGEKMANAMLMLVNDESRSYSFSSLCWIPFYEVDFGWGKPVRSVAISGKMDGNFVHLMDTPLADGIEVMGQLEQEEMAIFVKNKELVAYAQDI
ncbi:diaboline synthase-like [Rutidosis leptorrhynchoides]|uniref:diaboline synthase-like n=1 Tax=Rutidosis leptorrhynchoides TaxID=125765 RepID=UPI003A98F9F0